MPKDQGSGKPKVNCSFASPPGTPASQHRSSADNRHSFPPKNRESLQLCTEGFGSESSNDLEEYIGETDRDLNSINEEMGGVGKQSNEDSRSCSERRSSSSKMFPPPISSISSKGNPGIFFKSYKQDGRFVLREVSVKAQEYLQASREDGRLKLHVVKPAVMIEERKGEHDGIIE